MFEDHRGKIFFPVKNNSFKSQETIVSINKLNTFRGIHLEQFSKLVTCIQGKIYDIVINFNQEADDFLIPKYFVLDSNTDSNQILVPPNHGHGFLSLSDNSIVLYHFDGVYNSNTTKYINYKDPSLKIYLPVNNPILSDNDKYANFYSPIDVYVFGGKGFIGSVIVNELVNLNKTIYKTDLRLENIADIEKELIIYKPKYVICSAGLTGVPNISWCETHKTETIETNITYQMTLAHLCKTRNIHLTIIGSGVIFKNDRFYTEEEEGNYTENFYSKCRITLENMVKNYDNVLYVRINYPISSQASCKNLITKLLSYSTIYSNQITLTYIDELIPYLVDMAFKSEIGICNLVNEGTICITDIIKVYRKHREHICEIGKSNENETKSNSLLSIGKLRQYNIMNANEAIEDCIKKYVNRILV